MKKVIWFTTTNERIENGADYLQAVADGKNPTLALEEIPEPMAEMSELRKAVIARFGIMNEKNFKALVEELSATAL